MVLTDEDHARIKAVADKRGVSMARLFQESALSESYDRRGQMVIVEALDHANRLLANIAGNINQLAHHANATHELGAQADLEQALGQVRDVREELNEVVRKVK
jgi:Bacterial mobilisation protein (MobC)